MNFVAKDKVFLRSLLNFKYKNLNCIKLHKVKYSSMPNIKSTINKNK